MGKDKPKPKRQVIAEREFVQQVVAQIPWGHNIVILDKVNNLEERKWYIKKSAQNGWSRNVLVHQKSGLLLRKIIYIEKINRPLKS